MKRDGQGWILFSMIVLMTAGIMRIFDGIWLIHNSKNALAFTGGLLGSSAKSYGWLYLIVGVLLILVALSLMSGSEIGRWVGVAAGAILAITAMWAIPYYPVWMLTYIGLGFAVIYGLSVYGGSEKAVETT